MGSAIAIGILIVFLGGVIGLSFTGAKYVVYGFFYKIANGLFYICDFLQTCFRRLAGLEKYYYSEDNAKVDAAEGDVLLKLISSKTVVEALIAMTLFAVALLLIVTIIQIIRVEYTTEGSKNSKGTILGKAIKSFAMFILVPVVCFLGIFVSNKVLFALDAATSQSGASMLSGTIFLAGASEANVVRKGSTEEPAVSLTALLSGVSSGIGSDYTCKANYDATNHTLVGFKSTIFHSNKTSADAARYEVASQIDSIMVQSYNRVTKSSTGTTYKVSDIRSSNTSKSISNNNSETTSTGSASIIQSNPSTNNGDAMSGLNFIYDETVVHYSNQKVVHYFYDCCDMNFFVMYVGTYFILMSMIKASVGLIMRLYKGVALFIVSPAIIALTPIDDGNAYKSWRKNFLSCVIGAYGYVVGLNLLFLIMTVVDNISLFPDQFGFYTANWMVRALMVIVGVNMLPDLASLMSGFIGGEDVLKTGEAGSKKAMETAGKIGKAAVGTGMLVVGGAMGVGSAIGGKIAAKTGKSVKTAAKIKAAEETMKTADKDSDEYKKAEKEKNKLVKRQARSERWQAQGQRAFLRAREVGSDMFESSAVGSFMNNITGKYLEGFGGKGIKNIDYKLKDSNPDVMKKAGGSLTDPKLAKVGDWMQNHVLQEDKKTKGQIARNDEALKKMNELNKSGVLGKDGPYQTSGGDANNYKTYLDDTDTFKSSASDKGTLLAASMPLPQYQGVPNYDQVPNFESVRNNILGKYKEGTDSYKAIQNIQNVRDINKLKLNANDVKVNGADGETKTYGGKYLDGNGNLKVDDLKSGGKDRVAYDAANFNKIVAERGVDGLNETLESFREYDKKLAEEEAKKKAEEINNGGNNGNEGSNNQKSPENQNINLNNANVTMKYSKTEITGNADIKDSKPIADKLNKTVSQVLKNMEEKNEEKKNDKEQQIVDMLTSMNKTLRDIKKNTKK